MWKLEVILASKDVVKGLNDKENEIYRVEHQLRFAKRFVKE